MSQRPADAGLFFGADVCTSALFHSKLQKNAEEMHFARAPVYQYARIIPHGNTNADHPTYRGALMNRLLNYAFVPLFLAVLARFFYTGYLLDVEFLDLSHRYPYENWVELASLGAAILCFWHYFVRRRCPNCGGTDHNYLKSEEVDRYIGSKQVTGTDGKGRATKAHVSVTFVKIHEHYRCLNPECRREFYVPVKREHS